MAPPPEAATSYKKQNGVLAISKDRKSVSWSPSQPPDASPTLVVSAANVTNLQQTPETSAKVMLKIFAQDAGQSEPVAHVFTFTSAANARPEANAIKDALAAVVSAQKAAQNAMINAATNTAASTDGQSAAMTIANAVSGGGNRSGNIWEDDERLKADVKLQQSLMKEDSALQKTFMEALSMKPESISNTQFTAQFWSSRVHLLRAHAIANNQGRGRYNVFAELRRHEGGTKMNLTSDQVRVIFEQYPFARTVYDDLVPRKLNEIEFWSRFFQSQLYMAMRGLRFDRNKEAKDSLLDRFLDHPEITGVRINSTEAPIPKFIDLEGNEENHSQRQGNRPDNELRVTALDKAPIIRKLNALSEKLMASVRASDVDASAPIGMDEETYNETLRLKDLAGDPEQQRIILNIRDQSRFFSGDQSAQDDASPTLDPLRQVDPSQAIQEVCADLTSKFPRPGAGVIPVEDVAFQEDDGELDEEDDETADGGSKTSKGVSGSSQATQHILSLIQIHRDQTSVIDDASGLPSAIYERIQITHATTIEFLRQFWSAFLSGDAARVGENASLVDSLKRALDRIEAIAADAGRERNAIIDGERKRADEIFRKTGKRRRVDTDAVGGGSSVVKQLLGPIMRSLASAVDKYRAAYEEQSKDMDSTG